MLGYIKAYKPELRIKEYEMYKAVYCSLCKYMGRRYGFITRFALSYDFTFLSLLNMSFENGDCVTEKGSCVCNPFKKCLYCTDINDSLSMPAAAAVITVYYNILDNVSDERGIKRLLYRALALLLRSAHGKAARECPETEKAVSDYIARQKVVEAAKNCGIDAAAEPTANMLSFLCALCGKTENDKAALERLGYCLGKFIYITDAVEDYEKDIKYGRFNPFAGDAEAKDRAERNIYFCINEAVRAFELADIQRFKNILGNIVYMGLEDSYKRSKANERPL